MFLLDCFLETATKVDISSTLIMNLVIRRLFIKGSEMFQRAALTGGPLKNHLSNQSQIYLKQAGFWPMPKRQIFLKNVESFKNKLLQQKLAMKDASILSDIYCWAYRVEPELWKQLIQKAAGTNNFTQQHYGNFLQSVRTMIWKVYRLQSNDLTIQQKEITKILNKQLISKLIKQAQGCTNPKHSQKVMLQLVPSLIKFGKISDINFNQLQQYVKKQIVKSNGFQSTAHNKINLLRIYSYCNLQEQSKQLIIKLLSRPEQLGPKDASFVLNNMALVNFAPPNIITTLLNRIDSDSAVKSLFDLACAGYKQQSDYQAVIKKISSIPFFKINIIQKKMLHTVYHYLRTSSIRKSQVLPYENQLCSMCAGSSFPQTNPASKCMQANKAESQFSLQKIRQHYLQARIRQFLNKMQPHRHFKLHQKLKICVYECDFVLQFNKTRVVLEVQSSHYQDAEGKKTGRKFIRTSIIQHYGFVIAEFNIKRLQANKLMELGLQEQLSLFDRILPPALYQ